MVIAPELGLAKDSEIFLDPLAKIATDISDSRVKQAVDRCNGRIEAARDAYLRAVRDAKSDLSQSLEPLEDRATRSGDLDTAVAIRDL